SHFTLCYFFTFPYTTLFRSTFDDLLRHLQDASGRELADWSDQWLHSTGVSTLAWHRRNGLTITQSSPVRQHRVGIGFYNFVDDRDRKSTRLNSSHVSSSYAV